MPSHESPGVTSKTSHAPRCSRQPRRSLKQQIAYSYELPSEVAVELIPSIHEPVSDSKFKLMHKELLPFEYGSDLNQNLFPNLNLIRCMSPFWTPSSCSFPSEYESEPMTRSIPMPEPEPEPTYSRL